MIPAKLKSFNNIEGWDSKEKITKEPITMIPAAAKRR